MSIGVAKVHATEGTPTALTKAVSKSTPPPTPEILSGIYERETVKIEEEKILKDIQVLECETCTPREINTLLTYNPNLWKIVQHQNNLYIHSGRFTQLPFDYELAEIFRRLYKDENKLIGTLFCLNDSKCLEIIDFAIKERSDEIGSITDIFPESERTDYLIVTCSDPWNKPTQKLILLLRKRIN